MALIEHHGFSRRDLDALPEDGRRYELIGGSIVVSPSPRPRHQIVSANLQAQLRAVCPHDHFVFAAPTDLDLPHEQRVVPDLVIAPRSSITETGLELPVLLVVELVSPGNPHWDLLIKREVYAAGGIPHYWTIDTCTGHERFTAFRLPDGGDAYEVADESTTHIDVRAPVDLRGELAALFEIA